MLNYVFQIFSRHSFTQNLPIKNKPYSAESSNFISSHENIYFYMSINTYKIKFKKCICYFVIPLESSAFKIFINLIIGNWAKINTYIKKIQIVLKVFSLKYISANFLFIFSLSIYKSPFVCKDINPLLDLLQIIFESYQA